MYRYNTTGKSGSDLFGGSRNKAAVSVLTRIVDVVFGWMDRARQRRHLAELDDRLLRDIGISRAEVEVEMSRPVWRALD
jgi:uncharacterized protein YjiS (DUF1127 family)